MSEAVKIKKDKSMTKQLLVQGSETWSVIKVDMKRLNT
jgi:hypothetical protein